MLLGYTSLITSLGKFDLVLPTMSSCSLVPRPRGLGTRLVFMRLQSGLFSGHLLLPFIYSGRLDFVKRFCTSRTVLLALLVGCGLQLFQQFGGINTVM